MLCENRDIKPARDYFSGHETLRYCSLSAAPFNSLMLSTDSSALSTAAAHHLPVDLGVLGELAATRAKQNKAVNGQ